MSERSFIWTCDKMKFLDILCEEDEYWEKIGNKSNDLWYLKIILKKLHEKYTLKKSESFNFLFDFYLVREGFTYTLDVTVRWIQKTKIQFERNLHFDYNESSSHINEFCTKDDYELDIVLIFPENDDCSNYDDEDFGCNRYFQKERKTPVDDHLNSDLMSLFHSEYLADVTLKCGCEELKAHKTILSARSPILKTMFANDMQESNSDTVTIADMDTAVFHAWIHFLYGDRVKITSVPFASGLLHVGEKYQMKGLKEVCVQYLKTVLSLTNAIQIIEIADLYDEELKEFVICYAYEHLSHLKTLEEWRDLKSRKPALALDIYSFGEEN